VDDYTPTCAVSNAPDLVYTYTPETDQCLNITLCNSSHDTIIHVYDIYGMVACNDDFCGLRSDLNGISFLGGFQYFIVIDGGSGACGDYEIGITECPPPCDWSCRPHSIQENEPVCSDEYYDATNGGCDTVPPVYTELLCIDGVVPVCGTYGTFMSSGQNYRDTDWYHFDVYFPTVLTVCVCGSARTQLAIFNADCNDSTPICGPVFSGLHERICCSVPVDVGRYSIFVATEAFAGVLCGSPYRLELEDVVCLGLGVERAPWSQVKTLYR
jgi:hypothetical protein